MFNYIDTGSYNFYKDFSNYINKNLTSNYFNNKKKLRDALKSDVDTIRKFHDTEDALLNNAKKYISNNKFI